VGGNPYYFSMLFNLVCAFCSVLCVFQVERLPFKFGGASPTLCLTCAFPLVLYFFLSHWGQCDILVWGWGRHICLFIIFVPKKKKILFAMWLIDLDRTS
jgi:hypothetical protein